MIGHEKKKYWVYGKNKNISENKSCVPEKEGYRWFYNGKSSVLNDTVSQRINDKNILEKTFLFKLFGEKVSFRKTEMFLRRVD